MVAAVRAHEHEMVENRLCRCTSSLLHKNPSKSSKYLTSFSINEANALFEKWNKFDKYLLVKYIDGNTKRQDESGAFITNGHPTIPSAPIQKGYMSASNVR